MKRGSSIKVLIAALAAIGLNNVLAQEVQTLKPVVVIGEPGATALSHSVKEEKKRLAKVPGATNLVEPQNESGLVTLKDALNYQPGLIVQEFFGGIDQPRLNIRGSGIQSNPVNRGVLLMQDGLPLNEADGSFIIGFLEPRNSKFISVRRGANAISPAATTLGGELDFQSLIGSSGDVLRIEGGSFGRLGLQAAKGFESGSFDGRLSVTHDKSDGFRHHSGSKRTSLQGNFGILKDGFENRTYMSYVDLDVTIPTVVPRSVMEENPRYVMGDGDQPFDKMQNIYKRDPHRKSKQFRFANLSHWGDERLNNTVGVYTQTIDDIFQDPLVNTGTKGMTYGAQWQLAGTLDSLDYRFALDWARTDMDRNLYTVNKDNGSRKVHFADYDLKAENYNAMLGLGWHMSNSWTLVADAKFSKVSRNAHNRMGNDSLNQSWEYVSPSLGLIWEPIENQRFYVNISRNNEAPTFWEIINDGAAPGQSSLPSPMDDNHGTSGLSKLKVQRANTFEIGGQGLLGSGEYAPMWDLSYYYSDVKDELISVTNAYGNGSATYNYSGGTKHQGVEFGLSGLLPAPGAGDFDYRLAYTYSDFRFKNGAYGGNRIAGVPVHMISAELRYKINGWSFGPNLRWMPSKTETTHANTPGTQQDSYALLGFTIDYQINDRLDFYVRGDNLTNRNYASAFVIRNNVPMAGGKPNLDAPTFLPGNGRSVLAGLSYKF